MQWQKSEKTFPIKHFINLKPQSVYLIAIIFLPRICILAECVSQVIGKGKVSVYAINNLSYSSQDIARGENNT